MSRPAFSRATTRPMYSPSPRKNLLLLWGIAVVVLIGGVLLARQERQMRFERNHEALRHFAASAQVHSSGLRIFIRITSLSSGGRPLQIRKRPVERPMRSRESCRFTAASKPHGLAGFPHTSQRIAGRAAAVTHLFSERRSGGSCRRHGAAG